MGFPLITKEIADAVAAMVDRRENPPLFEDMTWSKRTYRAMERLAEYGLNVWFFDLDLADICQFSEKDLLGIHGFGRKSLEELRAKLSEFGWKLADQSHTAEELNRRFRTGNAPMWWDWHGSIRSHLASEAYKESLKEWKERLARLAAEPTYSIPTDPEAYDKWRQRGEGLGPHPRAT
jgi:hypothetical protein